VVNLVDSANDAMAILIEGGLDRLLDMNLVVFIYRSFDVVSINDVRINIARLVVGYLIIRRLSVVTAGGRLSRLD